MNARFLIIVLALFLGSSARAQHQKPEETANEYFQALKSRGVSEAAKFMHPGELARFKEMVFPLFAAESAAGKAELREATFGKGVSVEEIRKADPRTFLSLFLNLIGARSGVQPTFHSCEVLGVVPEDQVMHVLARIKVDTPPVSVTKMEVISMKQHEGKWMLLLNGQIEGFAQALAARSNSK